MDNFFEKNLLALSTVNPSACSRFSEREAVSNHYTFLKSRSGEVVPALMHHENAQPLHSMIDPKREAERLVSTITEDTGLLIFLGLGGGYAPEAALDYTDAQVLVIDYCTNSIAELFRSKDYTKLLRNERFFFLADPSDDEIKNYIFEYYSPSLCGGIKTIPLRARTEKDQINFKRAFSVIQQAIEDTASDYSVQAHFGKRWFSNIIRNIKTIENSQDFFKPENLISANAQAIIVAAGPSLDLQLPSLAEHKKKRDFIICSDTALPVLLNFGIEPDAAVSIDCQHISYYHFLGCNLNIPLFLDIASPPLLSRFSSSAFFFRSAHPLAIYVSRYFRALPPVDTSGGNVTYACLSLAEYLGAKKIRLFGADFSYIGSRTYARGTYIYPFFTKKHNRLSPLEALFSSFLYRNPFLPPETNSKENYYETSQLRFYRKKLEKKAEIMDAQITAEKGQGAPIDFSRKISHNTENRNIGFSGKTFKSGFDFLEQYRKNITALPAVGALPAAGNAINYFRGLDNKTREIFATLLPYAAALKYRSPLLKAQDLIEETKYACAREIERVLQGL